MSSRIWWLGAMVLASNLAPVAAKVGFKSLEVPLAGQQETQWCWASTAQMILATHGVKMSQCEQAAQAARIWQASQSGENGAEVDPLGQKAVDCCDPEVLREDRKRSYDKRVCVLGGWPTQAFKGQEFLYRTTKIGRGCVPRDYCALRWDQLTHEINRGRPVAFSWRFGTDDGGHMMVATGYVSLPESSNNDGRWVMIHDPWPPNNGDRMLISYDYYKNGPYGLHWMDFYRIEPARRPSMMELFTRRAAPRLAVELPEATAARYFAVPQGDLVGFCRPPTDPAACRAARDALAVVDAIGELEPPPPGFGRGHEQALEELERLAGVIGFTASELSPSLPDSAHLGPRPVLGVPIPVHRMSPDEIALDPDRLPSVEQVAANAEELIFPVIFRGKVRSAITVKRVEGAWRILSIGRLHLVSALVASHIRGGSGDGRQAIAVEVPSMYQIFLLSVSGDKLSVFPIFDDPKERFEAGAAAEVTGFLGALVEDRDTRSRSLIPDPEDLVDEGLDDSGETGATNPETQ